MTRSWNPNEKAYSWNEESMIDCEGKLIDNKDHQQLLLSEIEEYATIAVTTKICSRAMRAVENLIDAAHQDNGRPSPVLTTYPREVDQVSTVLASISPTLDYALLYESLRERSEMGKFKSSIGSTNGTTIQFLVDDDTTATEPSTPDDFLVNITDMLDNLYDEDTKGNIYLDDIMVSTAHASRPNGIDA